MRLSEVFTASAIAYRQSVAQSNKIPFLGEAFFARAKSMGIDLKWIKSRKNIGVALKPSAYDAIATIRPRNGFEVMQTEMPLFRESMTIKEQDMAEIQRAQSSNDPYLRQVLNNIYNDAESLIMGADISAERMRMQLLAPANGDMNIKIGMADNTAYNYEYDANGVWKSTNYLPLTSTSDKWDAPTTAKPLNDIETGKSVLSDTGASPAYLLMNSATFSKMIETDQIKSMFFTTSGIIKPFISKAEAKDMIEKTTELRVLLYDKTFTDYDGVDKKFYPDGYATIIGSGMLGNTWFGMTPEERTLMGDSKVDVAVLPSGVAVAIQNIYGPPVQHNTTASMICLPSYEGMDSVFVIKAY